MHDDRAARSRPRPRSACLSSVAVCIALASCAPKPIALPSDPGAPFADFAAVHAQLSSACAGVRTATMELGLSGRVGDERLRSIRVIAGFERPASMRLEGVAPFAGAVFVLVARAGTATLLLPRDEHIVRGAMPEAILEALTGVSLAPADLQAVLTGCVVPAPKATAGRLHAGDWASIDVQSGEGSAARSATLYLRRSAGAWQLRAARRDPWTVEYPAWNQTFPQSVRLTTASPVRVDLAAALSQIETNLDLDAAAFTVPEPPGVMAISVEDLRAAGPLRGK